VAIIEYFGYLLLYAYLVFGLIFFAFKGFSNIFSTKSKITENIIPTIGLRTRNNVDLNDFFNELGIESIEYIYN
jgi:hypothetical protein